MKVVEASGGLLTNIEVLSVLKDREADKQPVISRAKASEIEAYKALAKQNPVVKSREGIQAVVAALEPYELSKEELLQVVNLRPSTDLELNTCIPDLFDRYSEDQITNLLAVVAEHLSEA